MDQKTLSSLWNQSVHGLCDLYTRRHVC